jgi:anthranilate phosphoribosyltransferase
MSTTTITESISKLKNGLDLSYTEISNITKDILSGKTTDQQNIDFIYNLTAKGESDQEILGMLNKMQEYALKITKPKEMGIIIDMCGTGGDKLDTFNISTAASFVVAAAGGIVAKHGNRASSSICGSADVFDSFGYDLNQEPASIINMLQKHNICFIFAQKFHPAMKNISSARKKIAKKTIFNLLGPLSNPIGIKNQVIGVSSPDFLVRLPKILKQRYKSDHTQQYIITVRSDNGMDEFTTSSANKIHILHKNEITTDIIKPESLNLHHSSLKDIQIKTKQQSIKAFVSVLNNTANQAMIETVALNAAAGLITCGMAKDFDEGVSIALDAIKSEKPYKLFERFILEYGDISKLKEVQQI